MLERLRSGIRRRWGVFAIQIVAISLGACSALGIDFASSDVLPGEDIVSATNFQTYDAVEAAYGNVVAGRTEVPQLAHIGFDAENAPNVEKLSYLGVMDRFMPGDSMRFDKLSPAVQECIEAQEHCSAYVFRPARLHAQR